MEGDPPVISVRLDVEAAAALRQLEATGRSRSEVVRDALVRAAAAARDPAAIAAEVAELTADAVDREEMEEVRALMEDLRAPW